MLKDMDWMPQVHITENGGTNIDSMVEQLPP